MTYFEQNEEAERHSGGQPEHYVPPKKPARKIRVNFWKLSTIVLAVLLIVSVFTDFDPGSGKLSKEEAGVKATSFINKNLLQGQAVAKLVSVNEEENLYNLKLRISGQEVDSYVTKDGKVFFPQGMKIDEASALTGAATQQQETAQEVVKTDKPKVELFVMSHCPYGTQAEKGILPVANLLGDKIDFEVKFVYYAMHGKKELDEQMRQVCIKNEQGEKFNEYLACFLEDDNYERCLAEVKIDEGKLTGCVESLDQEYKITEKYNDQSTWLNGRYPLFDVDKADNDKYGIGGSPGLVVNGQKVNSGRSPAEYLVTICAAFSEAPEECVNSEGVSTESYQPGFGYEKGAATAASCG